MRTGLVQCLHVAVPVNLDTNREGGVWIQPQKKEPSLNLVWILVWFESSPRRTCPLLPRAFEDLGLLFCCGFQLPKGRLHRQNSETAKHCALHREGILNSDALNHDPTFVGESGLVPQGTWRPSAHVQYWVTWCRNCPEVCAFTVSTKTYCKYNNILHSFCRGGSRNAQLNVCLQLAAQKHTNILHHVCNVAHSFRFQR